MGRLSHLCYVAVDTETGDVVGWMRPCRRRRVATLTRADGWGAPGKTFKRSQGRLGAVSLSRFGTVWRLLITQRYRRTSRQRWTVERSRS